MCSSQVKKIDVLNKKNKSLGTEQWGKFIFKGLMEENLKPDNAKFLENYGRKIRKEWYGSHFLLRACYSQHCRFHLLEDPQNEKQQSSKKDTNRSRVIWEYSFSLKFMHRQNMNPKEEFY